MAALKFLIADDHAIVRTGLKQILQAEFPSSVIDEARDAEEMIQKVMKLEWDLVISDLSMPGRSGLEALTQIHAEFPKLPVLILSIHPEEQYATRILKAGAAGYLNKETATEELTTAVRRILQGRKYITPSVAELLVSNISTDSDKTPHEILSDREFEVLKLIASGKSVSEIAGSLFLSVTTVSTYRARVLTKMNLKNNADLTVYALEHKLI
jgi:two-component system, NarL family, invasion response regulator UvrY